MFRSLFRGIRLVFLIWILLIVIVIALGFVHQAVSRAHKPTRPAAQRTIP